MFGEERGKGEGDVREGDAREGDAGEGKSFLSAVPLSEKVESLMPLNLCVFSRTDRHAIRLCRRLNTCLFLSSRMTKNPRGSTEA